MTQLSQSTTSVNPYPQRSLWVPVILSPPINILNEYRQVNSQVDVWSITNTPKTLLTDLVHNTSHIVYKFKTHRHDSLSSVEVLDARSASFIGLASPPYTALVEFSIEVLLTNYSRGFNWAIKPTWLARVIIL